MSNSYTTVKNYTETLRDYFEKWDSLGWSYFPLPYKSKVPNCPWEQYQQRRPTEAEKQAWLADETPRNWALVLGKISSANGGCLVALDFDDMGSYDSFKRKAETRLGLLNLKDSTLIAETSRGRHLLFDISEEVKTQIFPNLEVRAEGAYILMELSVHPHGKPYKWLSPEGIRPFVLTSLKVVGIDVNQRKPDSTIGGDNWVTQALKGVPEGLRDATCTRLAGYYLGHGLHPDIVKATLYNEADKCTPKFPHAEVDKCVDSINEKERTNALNGVRTNIYEVYSRDNAYLDSNRDKSVTDSVTPEQDMSLAKRIVDWLKDSTGWCSYDDIDKDLNLSSAERTNRRQIIKRLKDSIVEANPKNNKLIRYINTDVRKIDFKSATKKTPLDIKFPFGIEQYFNIYSGNIVVVAGSPDAGKTAWILNLIRLNQDKHSIFYQCSEMDKEELASRLMNFEGIELDDWTFEAEKRSGNFADVIRPDCINIVDYMELTEDIYMVADYLKAIHEKLDSGIAIVALQKKIGANLGRGAEFSLEKPRLYLKMDAGETTIIKAKNWVRPDYNPNGLIIKYKIVGGCKFIITEDWYKPIQGAGK